VYSTGNAGVELASMLIGAICAERRRGALLVDREVAAIPIDRGGRGVDDGNLSTATRRARLIEHINRAGQIDLMGTEPLAMGASYRSDCSQVKTTIDTVKRAVDSHRVCDIGLD
jgi:hypothetical protein